MIKTKADKKLTVELYVPFISNNKCHLQKSFHHNYTSNGTSDSTKLHHTPCTFMKHQKGWKKKWSKIKMWRSDQNCCSIILMARHVITVKVDCKTVIFFLLKSVSGHVKETQRAENADLCGKHASLTQITVLQSTVKRENYAVDINAEIRYSHCVAYR